jgi:hypothetical protein
MSEIQNADEKPKRRGGRPKGLPKTGGRKKGVQNQMQRDLAELLHESFPGYDPVHAMAAIANDERNDLTIRLQASKEVARYVRPALRSLEVKGNADAPMQLVIATGIPND